jgi:myosin heavy subunit
MTPHTQECIDLIEGRIGLIAILDEESKFPKATEEVQISLFMAA